MGSHVAAERARKSAGWSETQKDKGEGRLGALQKSR